jgi:hypothetical protein
MNQLADLDPPATAKVQVSVGSLADMGNRFTRNRIGARLGFDCMPNSPKHHQCGGSLQWRTKSANQVNS